MKKMTISKIAKIIGAAKTRRTAKVSEVVIDSRKAGKGSIYFAIKGPNFDGHDYIQQALDNGAACAVSRRKSHAKNRNILVVRDTVKALGKFANYYRNDCGFKVVAITGSAGKTSTRRITHHILSKHFKCHQAKRSFNNNIGVPLTILGADPDCRIVITEMGTNNPGEIKPLSKIAEPDFALVNNIFAAHLQGLKTIENIIAEKASIAAGLKPWGKLLINADFPKLLDYCREHLPEFITFGTAKESDIHASKLISTGTSGRLTIEKKEIKVPLPGRGNLANALAAFAICSQFEIDADQFAKDIKSLSPIKMRMEVESFGPVTVINDCYNANPASMNNAVQTLADMASRSKRRSVFICGHMGELGEHAEQLHQQLGQNIGKAGINILITAGPFAESIADNTQLGSDNATVTSVYEDTAELCENLNDLLLPDDIILIKGSRTAMLEEAVNTIARIFKN